MSVNYTFCLCLIFVDVTYLPLFLEKIGMSETNQQFQQVIAVCRDLFVKKLHDYRIIGFIYKKTFGISSGARKSSQNSLIYAIGNLVIESGNVPKRGAVPRFSDLEVVAFGWLQKSLAELNMR